MATLESRVRRLETATGDGGCCPECGFDGVWAKVKLETHVNRVGPESPRVPPNKHCGTCGRVLVVYVGWGRDDPD